MKRYILILSSTFCLLNNGIGQEILHFNFGGKKQKVSVEHSVEKASPPFKTAHSFLYEGEIMGVTRHKKSPTGSFVTSPSPFYFFAEVPEGNYRVKVGVGDPKGISNTTIKAENRRLMVYDFSTKKGETKELSFLVSVRSARIAGEDSIRLKSREYTYFNWDKYLNLEIGGERPCISYISIEAVDELPVIFLCGNSTVVDQIQEPYASWGQMFPLFLKDDIVVANYAESGETLKSFIGAKRLKKIASQIKEGDYLFMEFAHNDQKPGRSHVEPYSSYQEYLLKFVKLARDHGATPVLVTSTNRRTFNESGEIENSLGDYPDAMRQLAEREGLALIDLHAMTKSFYEALGPDNSIKAFVHYPANTFPGQDKELKDNTHFSTYGAWQLAKCIVEGIKDSSLPINKHLKEDLPDFDPAQPDAAEEWKWPVSPGIVGEKPEGN